MECVFADINADHGNCAVEALRHGVLLCLWSPLPDSSLAGQEHGRTIPLADIVLGTRFRIFGTSLHLTPRQTVTRVVVTNLIQIKVGPSGKTPSLISIR